MKTFKRMLGCIVLCIAMPFIVLGYVGVILIEIAAFLDVKWGFFK